MSADGHYYPVRKADDRASCVPSLPYTPLGAAGRFSYPYAVVPDFHVGESEGTFYREFSVGPEGIYEGGFFMCINMHASAGRDNFFHKDNAGEAYKENGKEEDPVGLCCVKIQLAQDRFHA